MKTASQKAQFTTRILMSILTEQAELARIPGHAFTRSAHNEGQTNWIQYPSARVEIENQIQVLIRGLATAHGIAESYPMG
jgi:hypothetical protein